MTEIRQIGNLKDLLEVVGRNRAVSVSSVADFAQVPETRFDSGTLAGFVHGEGDSRYMSVSDALKVVRMAQGAKDNPANPYDNIRNLPGQRYSGMDDSAIAEGIAQVVNLSCDYEKANDIVRSNMNTGDSLVR